MHAFRGVDVGFAGGVLMRCVFVGSGLWIGNLLFALYIVLDVNDRGSIYLFMEKVIEKLSAV